MRLREVKMRIKGRSSAHLEDISDTRRGLDARETDKRCCGTGEEKRERMSEGQRERHRGCTLASALLIVSGTGSHPQLGAVPA